ncbi:hypothetical protein B0J17DRAFT_747521 [Rhizoctonia solani]|nr:hypothetical protein B0J17DRAFT_747521 [Rhizoctonia solani]
MRLSILTTLFTYIFFGIVHIVSATPVIPTTEMVVKRSNADISGVSAKLKSSLVVPLGGIDFAVTIPLLGGLLAGVDTSLNQVLLGLSILLQGVLRLVANLLISVAQLLRNLALGLSLGTLGL